MDRADLFAQFRVRLAALDFQITQLLVYLFQAGLDRGHQVLDSLLLLFQFGIVRLFRALEAFLGHGEKRFSVGLECVGSQSFKLRLEALEVLLFVGGALGSQVALCVECGLRGCRIAVCLGQGRSVAALAEQITQRQSNQDTHNGQNHYDECAHLSIVSDVTDTAQARLRMA